MKKLAIKLNPGEYECPDCKDITVFKKNIIGKCSRCNGAGKLDWVEMIVGAKKPKLPFTIENIIENLSKDVWSTTASACMNKPLTKRTILDAMNLLRSDLDTQRSNGNISNFEVNSSLKVPYNIDITIQPKIAIDYISLSFKIQ